MTFPERLRQLRAEAGMSQKKLAEKSGISPNSIMRYESGKVDPTSFMLCCLADALGVTTDYLLGRSEKK